MSLAGKPKTVGALRETGYRSRSVKQEMRDNLLACLRDRKPVFPGIVGYEDTVLPQVFNAILSLHDMLLLGLRGQAKTRILRALPALLDEYTPTPAGSDLPDDPLDPKLGPNRRLAAQHGDAMELRWLHRDERYHEKLATPDVTIADLIGEIDLVKHAEGRHLTDEGVIHYGLIPRTNRGIFAINELPDLAPRIQVGLFNVLEERDVQIRGFPVRLPLDICAAFTANPEDYTNRGRIVTPLKDRIGSVVRTHYPLNVSDAIRITRDNAWLARNGDARTIDVPSYILEVIENFARVARSSPHVNQQSGVSVRASITSAETLVSNAERRAVLHDEQRIVPRVTDLQHMVASCRGKIEIMLAEDDQTETKLISAMLGEAVKIVFEQYAGVADLEPVIELFSHNRTTVEFGDDLSTVDLAAAIDRLPALKKAAAKFCVQVDRPFEEAADLVAAAEFLLEGLHVSNRLSKYTYRGKTVFKR